ncbi:MAG: neutral/alkaline non-lysosomal ceramidase N-terminal domain-containing protein [Saprospiraceae bacterium]|nr:neutral/alkaline non-lysosomal ceramidase N-terminal domain-containing protein [Saprospiraceae bacterium]
MLFLSQLLLTFMFCGSNIQSPRHIPKRITTTENATISAGIARRNITPDPQVKNWVTGEPYGIVHDSIYARALVIDDGFQKCVIVNWELVDAGESATYEIRSRIEREIGIPAQNVMVNATHNHSAPWSPFYGGKLRGKEGDTWWAVRYMPAQNDNPVYAEWMEYLMSQTVSAVRSALESLQPVTLWVGRSDISAFVNNRRPRAAQWGVLESEAPENFNYKHEDWDPLVLGQGMTFGPIDRTMTLLSFRDQNDRSIATIFQLSAHAVSIYPFMDGISGDWPGKTAREVSVLFGGECIFLQGTAGDINPWRRGQPAVDEMAKELAHQLVISSQHSARLEEGRIRTASTTAEIPLTEIGKKTTGLDHLPVEVQVMVLGPLAIVTLPGEPMTELGMRIREQSPYPQTLVLGYSNGSGVFYVGMPGEKARGGYESGENSSIGTDMAGQLLVNAALSLLSKVHATK